MRGTQYLHPELQIIAEKFLIECEKQGLNVLITETFRTKQEQANLYAQGRTIPGKVVTNCHGYESPHCWGVAFDFCRNKKGWEYDNTDKFFNKVGAIAKTIFDNTEYDLFWGGDFKTFVDSPHIEMIKYLPNNSTKTLIAKYGTPEKFKESWVKKDDDEIMFEELIQKYGKEKIKEALDLMIKQQIDNENVLDWEKATFEKVTKKDKNGKALIEGDGKGNYDWQQPVTLGRLMIILDKKKLLD